MKKLSLFLLLMLTINIAANAGEGILTLTGFDFNGLDYTSYSANTKKECINKCSNDSRCKAFTFNINSNLCWLKSSIPPHLVRADGAFTGVKYEIPTHVFNFNYFVDFNGSDVGSYNNISDYVACMNICDKDDECRVFTYNVNSKRCYLKSNTGNKLSVEEAISGVKQ